jgi:hypothetical protein
MNDVKDYWLQKEALIGESVDAKFYCKYLRGAESVKGPLTGVLFFSRSTLFFQGFHSSKDLKTLFQMRRQEGVSETQLFKMPLNAVQCSFNEPPRTLWRRLFAAPEQLLVIHHMDGEQKKGSYHFSVDRKEIKAIASLING